MRWRLAAPVMLLLALSLGALGLALGGLGRDQPPALVGQAPLLVLAAILIAWLAAALLADWQARSLLRPLGELAQMARWLGQGDLEHRVSGARQGPFGPLAAALNAMGDRLQQQVGALNAERDRLSAILAGMADGVVIVDGAGAVVLINQAARRILHVPSGRDVGDSAVQVLRDHELAEAVRATLAGRAPAPWLLQLGQPRRWVRAAVTPLPDAAGRQALLVLQDVTDLRRAELVRREFVANVSHELRTPLATLKALVETLEG